jgi:hypothetical protein
MLKLNIYQTKPLNSTIMKKPFYYPIPGLLRLFALSFALLGILAGCKDDMDDLNPESKTTLLKNKDKSLSVFEIAQPLTEGLQGASGSTIGPDGALYVTEYAMGKISRIDPKTGEITTFASGFPLPLVGIGGVWDVAFLDGKAYALVTLVGSDLGGSDVVGIYRVDGPESFTVFADIGTFSMENPPETDFFIPTGVQYSIQTFRGGFLVADGHHNRILRVTCDGDITELKTFDNIVPTGLAVSNNTIYMAEAGPIPHLPENGRVVSFTPYSQNVKIVASGAPLLVDVEFDCDRTLFALSQGHWEGEEGDEGSPAQPNTGSLVKVNHDGTFTQIADGLDQPTSLEFIGNTAYILTLAGEIWTIKSVNDQRNGQHVSRRRPNRRHQHHRRHW